MSALRPIKPIPLNGLKPAEVCGPLPELMWLPPTSLLVDGTYQRDLSDRSMRLVRRMIECFAWSRMKPPIVVKSGPATFHIVDGQHTAIVAASLSIAQIPVYVVTADDMVERAQAFVGHNRDRVMVSQFDIYRALLAAGDPDAQDVDNVCRRAGVRIRQISPSSAIAEGDTAAINTVRALVKRRGVIGARKVLQCLVKAMRAPISAAEMHAAEEVICIARPTVDLEALSAVIRIEGSDGLAKAHARAKTQGTAIWREVMRRWLLRIDGSGA